MIELTTLEEANTFTKDNNLKLEVSYEYSNEIEKDKVISQSIKKGTELKDNDIIIVVVSKGKIDKDKLASDGINVQQEVMLIKMVTIELLNPLEKIQSSIMKKAIE